MFPKRNTPYQLQPLQNPQFCISTFSYFFLKNFPFVIPIILILIHFTLTQGCRSVPEVYSYVKKGQVFHESGTYTPPAKRTPTKNFGFRAILEQSTSAADIINGIREEFPYEWLTKLRWLEYAAKKAYPTPTRRYISFYTRGDFEEATDITQWVEDNLKVVHPTVFGYFFPHLPISVLQDLHEDTQIYLKTHVFYPDRSPMSLQISEEQAFSSSAPLERARLLGLDLLGNTITGTTQSHFGHARALTSGLKFRVPYI